MLKKTRINNSIAFEADLEGITTLQKQFLKGKKFVYFRKGEFPFEIAWEILVKLSVILRIISSSVTIAPYVKKGINHGRTYLKKSIVNWKKHNSKKNARYIRIISTRTKENKDELDMFKSIGAGVCIIPISKRERLRFFVNEKEYCLFVRPDSQENKFFGVIGNDVQTKTRLKQLFEKEYVENKK